jgi:hypothetical protein
MFNQTLKRPMFRRGGSTGEGITSGLRQGYKQGDLAKIRSQLNLINKLAPQPKRPKSSSLNDFMINFGLNMVGNAPTGNIFQTAAKQAQEPFGQFQKSAAQERAMDYQGQQGQRDLVSNLVKGLSDEELRGIEEKVQLHMRTHPGSSYEESSKAVWDTMEYSKSGHVRPEEGVEERLGFYETYLMNQVNKPPASAVRAVANHLYKMETGGYNEQLGEAGVADLSGKYVWFSDADVDQNATGGPTQIENGEVIKYKLSQNGINKWTPYKGKIVFDHRTGKLFRVMGTFLEVVEDINAQ